MKAIHELSAVCRLSLAALLMVLPGVAAAGEEPKGEAGSGVVAEIWPLDKPAVPVAPAAVAAAEAAAAAAAPREFEQWRSQLPPAGGTTMVLDKLVIPARETPAMVRVRGVFIPPRTCHYAFSILGPAKPKIARADEAELWLGDGNGGWRLVQRTGNPNPRSGRSAMKEGVPTRFEFWTMGSREISVQWVSEDWDPVAKAQVVSVPREVIPGSRMRARTATPDDPHDDGLRDGWKRKWGLDPASGEGPAGPWGDPDADGLPNWQEQLAGTHPLAADADGRAGLVRWETWRGIPGQYVFDLTRAAVFPQGLREVRYRDRLEIPVGNGDNYGSRLRGLLKAPASGEFTFMLIADDSAELWLGETASWQSKRLIARASQKGAAQLRWTRRTAEGDQPLFPEQTARVALEKGREYYVEVVHKQASSQDHCAVAWVRPGAAGPEVIGADALTSWQPDKEDADDDGLPDAWQQSAGLMAEAVDPAMRGATADPDRDGVSNREEWKAGSDPLKKNAADPDHALTCESWAACPGNQVRDLVPDGRFPAKPDLTTRVDNMDFSDEGDSYGARLRGYLTAPDDGSYVFSISGNNACTLYLADSEDKFAKRVIAWITSGTQWRSFVWQPSQRSAPVELKMGQRYYIEVLYKRGELRETDANRRDHSSVAWSRPGRNESVIGAEFFSPYAKDPRDLDDDDLPDVWERDHGLDPADPAGANGAWGDPDGDWLENFREFQTGLDPQVADVHGTPGLALWEYWNGIHGKLPGLKASPSFPLNAARREWLTSLEGPRGMGVFYGSRLRALVVAPVAGDYTFAIAGHNGCELSLSATESKFDRRLIASVENASKFRDWERHPTQISKPVRLQAGGRYFIEALHVQDKTANYDHLSVAWKIPGAAGFEVIGGGALIAFAGDPGDSDDDDLPDDWEKANGLDPTRADGDLDPDGDGLTNREEYRLGTRPDRADSDGDGVSDWEELRLYDTDPLAKDAVPSEKLVDLPPASARSVSGTWHEDSGGGLISTDRRGVAEYAFSVPEPGVFKIEIEAAALTTRDYTPPVPLVVSVDAMLLGRVDVPMAGIAASWITPWLAQGQHTLRLDNRNTTLGTLLSVGRVAVFKHVGTDANRDSVPDWLEGYLSQGVSVDAMDAGSMVSPVCLEGAARQVSEVSVRGGGEALSVGEGLTGRWFSNVPLAVSGGTKISVGFPGGSLGRTLEIEWLDTNVLEQKLPLSLRVGDSLKLKAVPSSGAAATGNLRMDGVELANGDLSTARVVTFTESGRHTVSAELKSGTGALSASMDVVVYAADFGSAFSVAGASSRKWNLPNVPKALLLESDPYLSLTEQDGGAPRQVLVTSLKDSSDYQRVVARLPDAGPIVAATAVNTFRIIDAAKALDAHMVNVLPDGTRVIEIGIAIDGSIPADLSIWLEMYVTDAVFANGDTFYHLTAADFDEFGIARITIYKAPGGNIAAVCHWIRPYAEDPTESPAEDPTENPAENPAEQPAGEPAE